MKIKSTLFIALAFLAGAVNAQTKAELFAKPGVIGDSLSQGFFGATVESKSQAWAYPVLVAKQAGSNVSYNVLKGPYLNLEDVLKGNCGPICIASSIIGGNNATVSLPTHAGITGAEYTTVLKTSGKCEDVTATKQVKDWYWKNWYTFTYRWITVADCVEPDKFHRFGLREAGTQMEIMEKVKPSFIFATAGNNHVLCTALHTSTSCLDDERFKRDFREFVRRTSLIGSVKGGVIFTAPNVTAIGYLEDYKDPSGRFEYTGRKAFYRTSVSSPNHVLDKNELARIAVSLEIVNNEIKAQAAANRWALTDAKLIFDDITANGRPIRNSSGYSPGIARGGWPLPGKPGIFGLDGVHPNMYGHAVLANELIKSINSKYGITLGLVDEYSAWYYDSLNQKPVDLKNFLTDTIFGQFITWVIGVFT
jgi:hypothetical protein